MPEYKHGKQTSPIDFDSFKSTMENGDFVGGDSHRSFLAFLYWFGVRRSEALAMKREDFSVDNEERILIVDCPAKKGGEREPLEIGYDLPYVVLILKQVKDTEKGERIWSFSTVTAWKIIKRAMGEKYYPHFFRLNRATHFLEDPEATIPEMLAWFGWKSSKTVDPYIGHSRRHIRKQRKRLEMELGETRK